MWFGGNVLLLVFFHSKCHPEEKECVKRDSNAQHRQNGLFRLIFHLLPSERRLWHNHRTRLTYEILIFFPRQRARGEVPSRRRRRSVAAHILIGWEFE